MSEQCLYCYQPLNGEVDFHESCSVTFFGTKQAPVIPYSFDEMAELARQVVERSIAVPGVQPKLSMSLMKEGATKKENRLTVVGALGGNYIFKPPSEHYPEMPANEHLTMRMAELFQIKTVPSSLIKLSSGELAYITKRVDRLDDGRNIHMLDMFQITEAFDKYISSMEKVGKAIEAYSDKTFLDKVFLFELTLFSFLTGNNDMHLKNFSMIDSETGWGMSPAYDLLNVAIANPEDEEELALTLEGKKKKLKREHFDRFAEKLSLTSKQTEEIYVRFTEGMKKAPQLLMQSFLSKEMRLAYQDIIKERSIRLHLD